jgi:hypothetical protein
MLRNPRANLACLLFPTNSHETNECPLKLAVRCQLGEGSTTTEVGLDFCERSESGNMLRDMKALKTSTQLERS